MSGQDLYVELNEKIKGLDKALSAYRKRGVESAESKRSYQVALAKEMLIQRNSGVPVTIIQDICKGKEEIAELRLQKDIAEALYKSAGEAINSYKLQIRILSEQIAQECGRR